MVGTVFAHSQIRYLKQTMFDSMAPKILAEKLGNPFLACKSPAVAVLFLID